MMMRLVASFMSKTTTRNLGVVVIGSDIYFDTMSAYLLKND